MGACNRHYIATTGKTLEDLLKAQSSVGTLLPGTRGGIAPYVLSVLERKEVCENLLRNMQPPASCSSERAKVYS